MHSIKKAARKSAWYQGEEKTLIPNPFGRYNARPRKVYDEENAVPRAVTENDMESPVESRRKQSYEENARGFEGLQKADTSPGGPRGNLPRSNGETISSEESNEKAEVAGVPRQNTGFEERSLGPSNEPRKRKMRKFLPWKHKGDDSDVVERTETASSKKKKTYPKLPVWGQIRAVFGSWINILLVFVPVGIALNYSGINKIVVFVINFIAIIPLAAMLSYATEELALYIGETLGGLLNASFGNAVELIIGVIALSKQEITIVQTSLIGSMLSNLLLVMGMCFFFGGLRRTEQFFNVTVAQTAASLLALAIGSLVIPTAFQIFADNDSGVTPTSRGTSVLLLVTYACYLIFQLHTHVEMYNEPSQKSPKKPSGKKDAGEAKRGIATIGAASVAAPLGGKFNRENLVHEEEEEEETPQLSRLGALMTLAGSTVFVALCAEYMVSSIGAVSEHVSQEFIGLILLPIVGNAAEHATAVTVAIKDKMDLAIGVAIGSSLQIALLVLPLMVLLNWWGVGSGGEAMTLGFNGFQVAVLFIAIIMVNYLIQDGKSHWLEGVLLQIIYLIIAVSAWFYPTNQKLAG